MRKKASWGVAKWCRTRFCMLPCSGFFYEETPNKGRYSTLGPQNQSAPKAHSLGHPASRLYLSLPALTLALSLPFAVPRWPSPYNPRPDFLEAGVRASTQLSLGHYHKESLSTRTRNAGGLLTECLTPLHRSRAA